ncbi:bifunctional phosphopantothenoylcysteine decarboxylase/phosphopantothenate--cysteine ligase CoaBC [Limnoraphis robusta Tam1]|uniref:Coenzyme A biosynthesis bifunctional protein CoaBC n=1 Tax=Limnoraphis robusta CCNP1315 TaxID=3110306 RepID=A0ABU5U1W8_9CYAN|nr:bifunctional phosphopantothenoylcysteine decarboxylase/phosphopantothenate--cysteine ligase CoaBC [Limnoraphis robusta]MEA5521192.1 bifunctional phosphopantothenoylcysteine decarboxylase/phosphopantothenate--cysteine ligase CoaBC [Limnoraphis robusta CCNP1315]MEA5537927.1 bifunctional phosphopantothenoylcysteine decarboxylase/phosphopantothenate--cysteine ligase CoaBC [Limnoraphis robusta Tam1]MEA5546658.1 bifunctional phosphopantothenoylcysteine decarboxylase/phosphopantothenate--cysteine li
MKPILPSLFEKRILIAVSGGIAAYKICEVISTLAKAGAEVRAILTDSAQQFITPLTLATLSRHQAYTDADFWQPTHGRPLHIQLGEWAELLVIAPLTANTLAKIATGMADNLLTNTLLASSCPVLLVPAMNRQMWKQNIVQHNWQQVLSDQRFHGIAPTSGVLACDLPLKESQGWQIGSGRMAEPKQILAHLESLLHTGGKRDLLGKRVLVSAGGTREHLDPVRFIGNPSTGKMGLAVAQAAVHRGATVTLVHAPMNTELVAQLPDVELVSVTSAEQMYQAMLQRFPEADITVMVAAVGDVQPGEYHEEKLAKQDLPTVLPLKQCTDILAELGKIKQPPQFLVGFAAQTGDILTPALRKLEAKNLDIIVANPVDQANAGFGSDTNIATLINRAGKQIDIGGCSKLKLAHHLFDFIEMGKK